MNETQTLKQLAHVLSQRTWGETADQLVFGERCVVAVDAPGKMLSRMGTPACLVSALDGITDPEMGELPDLLRGRIAVTVIQALSGDVAGRAALVGAAKTSLGVGSDRGITEIDEAIRDAVVDMHRDLGISIRVDSPTIPAPRSANPDNPWRLWRTYSLTAWMTADRTYHAPSWLTANVAGSNVTLAWPALPDRFDFWGVILRRASGATPPATATSGTGVTIANPDSDVSVVDAPGSGTWSYALFAGYDDDHEPATSAVRYSDAAQRASVTVV